MSLARSGNRNPLYGKTHTNETKQLMRAKRLGTTHNEATKEKMVIARGHAVYLYKLNTDISTATLSSSSAPKLLTANADHNKEKAGVVKPIISSSLKISGKMAGCERGCGAEPK